MYSNHAVALDKPRRIQASNIQFNTTDISWSAPVEKRNITGFLLTLTDVRRGTLSRLSLPAETQYTLTGLYADTLYSLTLQPRLRSRRGRISEEFEFRSAPFGEKLNLSVLQLIKLNAK